VETKTIDKDQETIDTRPITGSGDFSVAPPSRPTPVISRAWAASNRALAASENLARLIGEKPIRKARDYWHSLGPGLTTGAADDDPSGIATYSQTGAKYGFNLLWLSAFTFPLMAVVQEMCARIGLVTGRGLAGVIRRFFPKWVLYCSALLLLVANSFNIGADLGAMAEASRLLFPRADFTALVLFFTILSLSLQIFISYRNYARYLKWLSLVLLSYILTAAFIHFDGLQVLRSTVVPHLNFTKDEIFLITGILGTTISPYLFFWQTSQEVEEQILGGKSTLKLRQAETTPEEVGKMRTDVWSGMFFSNLTMFFIILACAATLHKAGLTNIQTAAEAAAALRPLAGNYAFLLFAVGVIGVGLLAVPVLAGSASYALAEAFGWKEGLYYKFRQAQAFYATIIFSVVLGLLLNFTGIDSIKALIYSAVANGLVAPVVLVLIVLISSNKKIMGKWVNHPIITFIGWVTTGLMAVAGIATIISLLI